MNRLALVVSAAAVLLTGGCGGPPSSPSTGASEPVTSTALPTAASAAVGGSTITVAQEGQSPPNTLWYLRIEDTAAKPVLEQAYPGQPISVTRTLPPGAYRVVVWHRPCTGRCPTVGEDGLGPLGQVCGAKLDLTPGAKLQATAQIKADGGCAIKAAR
ncbi:hypothetical protein GCM10029976_031870 [Kribbella albertanoniae]